MSEHMQDCRRNGIELPDFMEGANYWIALPT
jgi:hypothetical protein